MRLPAVSIAKITKTKVLSYLLATTHPAGQTKARFFNAHGFERRNWEALVDALVDHARQNDVTKIEQNRFGMKYVIKGKLTCPDGGMPMIVAVWFIEAGEAAPRLVTAYPVSGDE